MSLSPGTQLGPYQILAKLGEGGMGEVYRARDTRLNRDVALKVIPASFATDPDRLARFRREAQALASLNHPNIGHIYGLEEEAGSPALVLELIEGPTLADRLRHGNVTVPEALQIARQVALALEAAHEQGIVHRDLKPSNIKVKDDGTVKVLDFGLAKALAQTGASATADGAPDSGDSPTLTNRATALGLILGTAAYMAPEQAKGKPVDKRADIWSFGVVFYEMLAGRRLFRGDDVSDTLAEVLKVEINWRALPASTPTPITRLLRRCLERDVRQRLHDIADARVEIDEVLAAGADAVAPPPVSGVTSARERWLWGAALIVTAVGAAIVTRAITSVAAPSLETRLEIVTPPSRAPLAIAVSPDGRNVAFVATVDGKSQIWVRPLDAAASHPIPGSDIQNPAWIEWSSDSASLYFSDTAIIKTIPIGGGTARSTPARAAFGQTVNAHGTALIAPSNGGPIARVPLDTGTAEPITQLVAPVIGHRYPSFLPDGRHFVFLATGPVDVQGVYLAATDSKDTHLVALGDTAAVFLPPDYVVFGRQDTLLAQQVDLRTGGPIGQPYLVADGISQTRTVFGGVSLAASAAAGTIAYRELFVPRHQLRWVDREGTEISRVGDIDSTEFGGPPRLSPDRRTILTVRRFNGNWDVWTTDNAEHGAPQRLTTDPAADTGPVWSPDGSRVAFSSARRGGGFYSLYETTPSRAGTARAIFDSPDNVVINDWSGDNKYILFQLQGRQSPRDLWAMAPDGAGKAIQITNTPADETAAKFSPDGHWIAYQSTASGTGLDVFVRSFPDEGREWRISTAGGTAPMWNGDGRELFYVDRESHLMAVSITPPAKAGGVLEHGQPHALFTLTPGSTFEPARDGQKFLVNAVIDETRTSPIAVILNWRPAAKR